VKVELELTDAQLDAIAARAAELVAERQDAGYMNVEQAAEFLACGRDRIYALVSAGRIPHERDGSRLLFDRQRLREYVKAGGAKRPAPGGLQSREQATTVAPPQSAPPRCGHTNGGA
jgi:excisionase family DNA binding protein